MDETQDTSDEAGQEEPVEPVEPGDAGLDQDAGEDDDDQDFAEYAKTHQDKLDAETRELVDFVKGPDVNTIDFAELSPSQLGEISDDRLAEFIAWRDAGGLSTVEVNEMELAEREANEYPLPLWGTEEGLSDKDFQASLGALVGARYDDSPEVSDESH